MIAEESTYPAGPDDNLLPMRKIHRLLAYVENVGLDPVEIAASVGLELSAISEATPDESIPSLYYALIYKETVQRLQNRRRQIPWAAGIGSDAFRMMCYCIISCKTLREALMRAERFDALLYPVTGHRVSLDLDDPKTARLGYIVDESRKHDAFAPGNWTLEQCLYVARSSGLETWFGLCGWLIGRGIELRQVTIAGGPLSRAHEQRLKDLYRCPVSFHEEDTAIRFPARYLDFRIVHDSRSLEKFLDTGPHQLLAMDSRVVSTSAAIRSYLGTDFREGVPSFEDMARNMHMSSSTLRRHLLAEGTSYQKIKDEARREIATEMLCFSDARVSDISEHVGFADTSSFVRSFRSWTGITPKAYREQSSSLLRSNETDRGG